ncbi:MAG: VWA domain-containing protein [Bacteroidetes bacterium]|nr:VWA domain-containing protein [Bacteroidota bacterium]
MSKIFKLQLVIISLLAIHLKSFSQNNHIFHFLLNGKPLANHQIELQFPKSKSVFKSDYNGQLISKTTYPTYWLKLNVIGHDVQHKVEKARTSNNHIYFYFSYTGYQIKEYNILSKFIPYSITKVAPESIDEDDYKEVPKDDKITTKKFSKGYAAIGALTGPSTGSYTMSVPPDMPSYAFKTPASSTFVEPSTSYRAGLLTAGEVNDFSKWKLWKDIADNELATYNKTWGMKPEKRYSVLVLNNNKRPVINAKVQLITITNIVKWETYTDNTGKAELWNDIYKNDSSSDQNLRIKIIYNETVKYINKVSEFHNGINKIKLDVACDVPNKIDIAFIVDATGSMGDEIEYLKTELNDVIQKAKAALPHNSFRLGSVFYRDFGDEYVTRISDLDTNIQQTIQFIKNQRAGGGGDEPEGVDTALSAALNYMNWDKQAITRIAFLVLDAPPHQDEKTLNRIKILTQKAAAMGIRLVPLTASGIGKTTEYLMRCMALATNGTYVFLTDDSGIGGSHIKPTTDKYNVELLNDLLVRLIKQYSYNVGCEEIKQPIDSSIKDTFIVQNPAWQNPLDTASKDTINQNPNQNEEPKFKSWKVYPNPTEGPINIDIEGDLGELFLTDNSGKILQRIEVNNKQQIRLDIREYPQGIYYLKYIMQKGSLDAKVLLVGNK